MKTAGRITHALMSFAMLFATTAYAANKGSLHVQSTTMAGKTQLPAGDYTVQWEGTGPDVELKIKLHNRVNEGAFRSWLARILIDEACALLRRKQFSLMRFPQESSYQPGR